MSAEQYHEFMLNSEFDRKPRALFQDTVLRLVRKGGTILDFGAGTGIDAKAYAKSGHKVFAYDSSSEMRAFLAEHCRNEVSSGQISVIEQDYGTFLTQSWSQSEPIDAIAANFAVLNLITDHRSLFGAFERRLSPQGFIFASLLNPYYLRDVRNLWWWRNTVVVLTNGQYTVGKGDTLSHRFGVRRLEQSARPHFVLRGILPSNAWGRSGERKMLEGAAIGWWPSPALYTSLFMFLLFRRP